MKSGVRHSLAALATLLVVAGASAVVWRTAHAGGQFYTDADTIREPAGAAAMREVLWQPATALPGAINSEQDEYEPRLSSDGATLFFVRGKAGGGADIYTSERSTDGWSEPAPLTAVNSASDDLGPAPSADGRTLYFYSNRSGGFGGYDLWVSHKSENRWDEPVNLGPGVNTEFNEYGPAPTPDGTVLYFASDRPRPGEEDVRTRGAWPATLREGVRRHDYDLYSAALTESGAGTASALTGLNTEFDEGSACVSPFGDFLYFSSDRPGGMGGFDIYRSRRLRGEHLAVTNLGPAINSAANELDPALSMGGFQIHFSSDRPVARGGALALPNPLASAGSADAGGRPTYDIYTSTSREVFIETEPRRAVMALSGVWLWIVLALLTLLLTAALLYALLRRLKGSDGLRKLSLLARCLIASLLVHALLMLSFTVWRVSSAMGHALRTEGGATRVTIATPGDADAITSQIRGSATDVQIDAPLLDPINRVAARMEPGRAYEVNLPVTPLAATQSRLEAAPEVREAPAREAETRPIDPSDHLADVAPSVAAVKTPAQATPTARAESSADISIPTVAGAEPIRRTETLQGQSDGGSARIDVVPEVVPPFSASPFPDRGATASASDSGPAPRDADAAASAIARRMTPPISGAPLDPADLRLPSAIAAHRSGTAEARLDVSAASVQSSPAAANVNAMQSPIATARAEFSPEAAPHAPAAGQSMASPAAPSESAISPASGGGASRGADASPPLLSEVPLPSLGAGRLPGEAGASSAAVQSVRREGARAEESPGVDIVGSLGGADTGAATPREVVTAQGGASLVQIAPSAVAGDAGRAAATGAIGQLVPDAAVDARTPAPREEPLGVRGVPSVEAAPRVAMRLPGERAGPGDPMGVAERRSRAEEATSPDIAGGAVGGSAGASSPRALSPDGAAASIVEITPSRVAPAPLAGDRRAAARGMDASDARVDDSTSRNSAGGGRDTRALAAISGGPAIDLRLPSETAPPENPYRQREPEQRKAMIERLGGSPETERAVALALAWLQRHQSPDGHWDGAAFDHDCGECGGTTNINSNVALTGLSTLCFLAADHTPAKDGPYRQNVARSIDWLLAHQSADGDLRSGETMYSHAIGAIALSEALGMTGDARLRDPVERAVAFIAGARNKKTGGWRYEPGMPGDTSVLGWQVMAMVSAKRAGIAPPGEALAAAGEWLEKVSTSRKRGLYAYQPGGPPTESMTAEGMFVQQLLGASRDDPRMAQSAEFVVSAMPNWRSGANTYAWYYATLALYQHQGPLWEKWNSAVKRELLLEQRTMGGQTGSWDPVDRWSSVGGRVYQTAICTLSLEVYYRYLPMYVAFPGHPGPPRRIDALGAGDGAAAATLQDQARETGPPGAAPLGGAAPE